MAKYKVKVAPPTENFEIEAETSSEAIDKATILYDEKHEAMECFEVLRVEELIPA